MDYIADQPMPLLETFFEKFDPLWSRPSQRQAFRAYVLGLLSEAHGKNIEGMNAKMIAPHYQSLHHFATEAPWSIQEANRRRLELLMGNRRTAPRPKGVLVIDDSGVPKRVHRTEGVKRQYIGQLGKKANGQVFVTSHYADLRCHWPVDLLPYIPDAWWPQGKDGPGFRNKLELAIELVDRAVALAMPFRAIVSDSWYGSNTAFIAALDDRQLPYVAELKPSQRIFARLPGDLDSHEHRLVEALSLLKSSSFRPARLKNADGTEREVHVASLMLKIKHLTGKRRVVVVTTQPGNPAADADLRWLLTNVVQMRNDTVAQLYALRNWVEVFYREAKDDLGAGQYQVRDMQGILRHWQMVFVAYSMLVALRQQGRLGRWCKTKLRTVRQTLMALRDLMGQIFYEDWLPKHIELFKEHRERKSYVFNLELTK